MRIHLPSLFRKNTIKVTALVGPSGTGKSFRAKLVASSRNIEMIIDDGLLIKDNSILAGTSAKNSDSYLKAVRIAIFEDEKHQEEVKKAIEKENPKTLLILGTSDKMIKRICQRLDLPLPFLTIKITDVASKEEIEGAINSRKKGKHVIPVPKLVVKNKYPLSIIEAFELLIPLNIFSSKKKRFEKTIIQPDYESPVGTISISDAALSQMIIHCVEEFDTNVKIKKINVKKKVNSYHLKLDIQTSLHSTLPLRLTELRDYIKKNVEKYTVIHLEKVDINIVSMSH